MWAVVDDDTNEDDNKNNCDVDLLSLPPLLISLVASPVPKGSGSTWPIFKVL